MLRGIVVVVIGVTVSLAGCTPTPEPVVPDASPTVTESSAPTVEPTPVVEPLTIPGCETLVPLAFAQEQFGGATEFFGERTAAEHPFRIDVAGAPDALVSADTFRGCVWGVPNSDGSFSVAIATISDDDRDALQASLVAAGFAPIIVDTVSSYRTEFEGEVSRVGATYVFTDGVVIMTQGTGLDLTDAIGSSAYEALIVANPTRPL